MAIKKNDKKPSNRVIRDIRLKTHKSNNSEEKIRILIEALRGDSGYTDPHIPV